MASRVTQSGRRDRRFSNQGKGFKQQVYEQGAAAPIRQGLGEMPLTLWVIVAAIVVYFYVRRASLGIDRHPAEKATATIRTPAPKPIDVPQPRRGLLPILPPVSPEMGAWFGGGGWSAWVGKRFGGE